METISGSVFFRPSRFSKYPGKPPDENQRAANGRCSVCNGFVLAVNTWNAHDPGQQQGEWDELKMILRNRAIKVEILACPNATNMFWQARCKPKIVMPPRKTGMAQLTVSISRVSLVNARAMRIGEERRGQYARQIE